MACIQAARPGLGIVCREIVVFSARLKTGANRNFKGHGHWTTKHTQTETGNPELLHSLPDIDQFAQSPCAESEAIVNELLRKCGFGPETRSHQPTLFLRADCPVVWAGVSLRQPWGPGANGGEPLSIRVSSCFLSCVNRASTTEAAASTLAVLRRRLGTPSSGSIARLLRQTLAQQAEGGFFIGVFEHQIGFFSRGLLPRR